MSMTSVTSGFYDAVYTTVAGVEVPDRAYNSKDIAGLLEGFIGDGVFSQIGSCFNCTAGEEALELNVGSGRAWFNKHWINNSTTGVLTFDQPDIDYPRRDAVVIDIDESDAVRAADIKIVKGTGGSAPRPDPTLINTATHHQYIVAVVDFPIRSEFGSIGDANCPITYRIGTNQTTPFVTNILNVIDPSYYTTQLQTNFTTFLTNKNTEINTWKTTWNTTITTWYNQIKDLIDSTTQAQLRHMVRDTYAVTLTAANWEQIVSTEPYKYKYDLDVTSQSYTNDSVVEVDLNTLPSEYATAELHKQAWAYVYASEFSSDNTHLYLYAFDLPNASIPIIVRGK